MHVHTDGRESEHAFCAQLDQFSGLFFVAECDGSLVGVVLGSHDHRKGWINRLAVLPNHQRRGIGAALVAACEAALRKLDLHVIAALVETHNLSSAGVFEKLGYDIESRDPRTGRLRFLEVKGRVSGAATITVTKNEILYSLNKPEDFILAIVEFLPGDAHRVHYVRRPFQREPDFGVTSVNYDFAELLARAEVPW